MLSEAFWRFSENSSVLVGKNFPYSTNSFNRILIALKSFVFDPFEPNIWSRNVLGRSNLMNKFVYGLVLSALIMIEK